MTETGKNVVRKKRKSPQKEKKIISKYYAGTDVRKLPKIPKPLLNDLSKIGLSSLTEDQIKGFLSAVVVGAITDKFGLEASLDTRIKAAQELTKIIQTNKRFDDEDEIDKENGSFMEELKEQLESRNVPGVDEDE